MKKIYISGKITGVPDFRDKFARVEKSLTLQGHVVFNPATLPAGLEYEEYMHIDLAMVAVSDAIYMLPCWKDSPGAIREKRFAESLGREVLYHADVIDGVKPPPTPMPTRGARGGPFG